MKSTFLKSLLILSLLNTPFSLSAAETDPPTNSAAAKESSAEPTITLYANDNDKNIIKTLSPSTRLIKIYQKGDWIKVGNPEDGTVGWINQKQYQQALEAFYKPNIQEIVISQTTDKNNKPQIKIVAYKNGKPISQKEAEALYENVKKQQAAQAEYWEKFSKNMVNIQNSMMKEFFENPFFTQPMTIPLPVIVVEKEDNSTDKKN